MTPAPASLTCAALILLGCSAAPVSSRQTPAASATTPAAPPPDPIASAGPASFKTHHSRRFDLALPLPDGASFEVDEHERWLVATHGKTGSKLLVRVWREDDIGGRERCEARARLWKDLPAREGTKLVETRKLAFPPDHDTTVEVRVRTSDKSHPIEGYVLAFGGWAKKCFAYVFTTSSSDERVVASRLATMTDGSLARLRMESELAPGRLPHEKLP